MGGLEYWQTRFTYRVVPSSNGDREVTLAEQATEGPLSPTELPAGRLFAIGRDRKDRLPCVFRIEVEIVSGSGRTTLSGVRSASASGALHTAHDHIRNRLSEYQIPAAVTDRDLHVQILNPMEADEPTGLGLGIFLAIVSALRRRPVRPGMVVIGDLSVQGSILEPDAVGEMILLARESGAKLVLVPSANRDDVRELPTGIQEGVGFDYFSTPSELLTLALG